MANKALPIIIFQMFFICILNDIGMLKPSLWMLSKIYLYNDEMNISPVHNGQIRKGIRVSFRENGKPMPYLASDDARSLGYSL